MIIYYNKLGTYAGIISFPKKYPKFHKSIQILQRTGIHRNIPSFLQKVLDPAKSRSIIIGITHQTTGVSLKLSNLHLYRSIHW